MKTILLLLAFNISFGQSLITNSSFELYDSIPVSTGQIKHSTGWKSIGSADFFHEYATPMSLVNIPYCFAGVIQSYEGQACAGICCYMDGWVNYREYLYYKFDNPMVSGNEYHISLYVFNNPSNMVYGGYSIDGFGIALSMTKLQQPMFNNTPQYVQSGQLYGYGWKEVQVTFLADSNYKFITIGSFISDSIQVQQLVDTALVQCAYFFIDNVVVEKIVPLGVEEHGITAVKKKIKL